MINIPYKDKEKARKWQKERRYKYKEKLIKIKYKTGECQLCGWDLHPEILQFHHKDPTTKLFNLADGNIGNRDWLKINKEIDKCILLCPNCHNWLHYQEKDTIFKKYGKLSHKAV